ncbi:MAG: glycosyltransferase [Paludibacteraceae bacterium]|nr:glycosyltransferase [Paludibacteraceae bacterium]
MKIYSLLLVKNEADIIRESLTDACRWSDKIIVIDNGSSDHTWETIQELAKQYSQIIPWMRYEGPFHIGLRALAFRAFRHEMSSDDWWCVRLDADEFYTADVRDFLSKVPRRYSIVKKQSKDYILTAEDIEQYSFTGSFAADRTHITHCLPTERRERRFMRHSPLLCWATTWRYPHPWGLTAPECIPVDHYQYRSPEQMQKRFLTRQQAKQQGCGSFHHETGASWKDYVPTNRQLNEQHILSNIKEEFALSDRLIHSGRNTIRLIGEDIVAKRFARPSFFKRIIYTFFRKSKAERSYMYAKRLGALTPEPVGWKIYTRFGLISDSYYLCRRSILPYTFRQLEHDADFPQRQQHIEALAKFTAGLHRQGIIHLDYSGGNILFDDDDNFQIVDLNRMRFNRKITLRQGCRNFSRLNLTEAEYCLLGKTYAEERGFNPDLCKRLVVRMRWNKHKKQT